jgi:hypothetical protein
MSKVYIGIDLAKPGGDHGAITIADFTTGEILRCETLERLRNNPALFVEFCGGIKLQPYQKELLDRLVK